MGAGEGRGVMADGDKVAFGVMEYSGSREWPYNPADVLNTTELNATLKK